MFHFSNHDPIRPLEGSVLSLLVMVIGCSCPTQNLHKRASNLHPDGTDGTSSVLRVEAQLHPETSANAPNTRWFQIAGSSMEPRYETGDVVLIQTNPSKWHRDLRRGALVVFRRPEADKKYFIKRIIGLPGERVTVKDGNVWIFNKQHPEGALLDETAYISPCEYTSGDTTWRPGPSEYVVLGDHREGSRDTRQRGPLPVEHLVGRVLRRAENTSGTEANGSETN